MTIVQLVLVSGLILFGIGLYGLWSGKNVLRWILAVGILETGVNILLVLAGTHAGGKVPILTEAVSTSGFVNFLDPVPSALVLTSIVIGLGTTTLALSLVLLHAGVHQNLECAEEAEPQEVLE